MSIMINSVSAPIGEPPEKVIERAVALLKVSRSRVTEANIAKTSLDARRRTDIHFVYSVAVTLDEGEEQAVKAAASPHISLREEQPLVVIQGTEKPEHRPVIVGFGPAGMFAGLLLARHGYRPVILERGGEIERRVEAVERFWHGGALEPDTNVQFGEGGAGTFSDGKLTTRIGDPKCAWVLKTLAELGAPPEILYRAKPHIGTDRLREVVKNLRGEIISLGGEVRFDTALTDLDIRGGQLCAAVTQDGAIPTETLILATGHSARDTFEMLSARGFLLEAKPFSVGVRIEHLQAEIDKGLYGALAGHPSLPVGEYQLSHRERDGGRGVYTFCMCPGGVVVPSASEAGMTVTNGMSFYARDGENANSAVAVSVTPDDYGKAPLDGMRFQRELEHRAFLAGGGRGRAPAQDVGSFLSGKAGLRLGRVSPTFSLKVESCDFSALFPEYISTMLKTGLRVFDGKLRGFAAPDAVLTGVETRTSSPIRVVRGENLQSPTVRGVYPCAEGAGYAGGIMSAAVDGMRVALAVISEFAPL